MDVASITNNISITKVNNNKNIDPQIDIADAVINTNSTDNFDYSKVMMDLEEVQDFLFMLIGFESPAKAQKGTKLNLFA